MSIDTSLHYLRAVSDMCECFAALKPPRRVTVAEGASESLMVKQPGLPKKPWSASETPYMVEPMNMLASRVHDAVCFVGPARSGKTMGFSDAWMAHVVANDPGDMMIVQMSQDKAREYSRTRIDRALEYSPVLEALKSHYKQDDNTHDKRFKHGMWLRIAWPTKTNLSGSDYRYVVIPDYDRTPDDVEGEGSKFMLGVKRTQTFMSRGMCAAESSPGRLLKDPNWKPATMHEAPPVGDEKMGAGILGIYNQSDRRRWYWQCFDCRNHFEAAPGLSLFRLPDDKELIEIVRETNLDAYAAQFNAIFCPHCDSRIEAKYKNELNTTRGRWLRDGCVLTEHGEIIGDPMTSSIAGFWLGGVAATYQGWKSIVQRYLQGLRDYALNGDENALQATVNTDQGAPYLSQHMKEAKAMTKTPVDFAEKDQQRYIVPIEARTLIASVDVQGGSTARFEVQVHAVGPYREQWLVDRYSIKLSEREGMGEEAAPIDPAGYAEDWDQLTKKIVLSTYKTTVPGREMRVKLCVVDTGGEDGVTDRAYAWYRRLRRLGLHKRVMLTKGNNTKTDWIIKETLVGRRSTKEDGDVPLYLLNPHACKDIVHAGMKRALPGPGFIHFPLPKGPLNPEGWLPKSFFDEYDAEVRNSSGIWEQIRKRNETHDLCHMIAAGCLRLGLDKVKWDASLPTWLLPQESNTEVISRAERIEMKEGDESTPVPVTPEPLKIKERRISRSSYLGN